MKSSRNTVQSNKQTWIDYRKKKNQNSFFFLEYAKLYFIETGDKQEWKCLLSLDKL